MGTAAIFRAVDLALTLNNVTDKAYNSGGQEGAYLLGADRTVSFTVALSF